MALSTKQTILFTQTNLLGGLAANQPFKTLDGRDGTVVSPTNKRHPTLVWVQWDGGLAAWWRADTPVVIGIY